MKEKHDIVRQVLRAQTDRRMANELIEQYLPYIKSETAKCIKRFPQEEDDELSIAMFAFYEAILAYRSDRGAFLPFAGRAIQNRLIDYRRKQLRHEGHVSLDTPVGAEEQQSLGEQIPDERQNMDRHQDRSHAQEEIAHYAAQLSEFGLCLNDVAESCPKQERTLDACLRALEYARSHPELLEQLLSTRKIPLAQLVSGANVKLKTLERHRKYLVAIMLAYTNGFEIIRGHLQFLKRKEEA